MKKTAIIGLILIACIIFTGTYYIKKDKPTVIIEYTATKGGTLWELYEQYGTGSWDKWLWEVKQLNGKETSGVMPGEVVRIYVEVER